MSLKNLRLDNIVDFDILEKIKYIFLVQYIVTDYFTISRFDMKILQRSRLMSKIIIKPVTTRL